MSLINPLNQASMTEINSQSNTVTTNTTTNSAANPFLDGIHLSKQSIVPEAKRQQLTRGDILSLLSQLLSMQDSFKPIDNDQLIAQMACLLTVDGISTFNDQIVCLNSEMSSSRALHASRLVGRNVLIPKDTGNISTESPTLKGVVSTLDQIPVINVCVEDQKGQVISTFTVDGSEGGNVPVVWDGLDKNGQPVAVGNYSIKASGLVDGASQDLAVSTYAHVSSVSLGTASAGTILNLRGGMGIKLSDVLVVSET